MSYNQQNISLNTLKSVIIQWHSNVFRFSYSFWENISIIKLWLITFFQTWNGLIHVSYCNFDCSIPYEETSRLHKYKNPLMFEVLIENSKGSIFVYKDIWWRVFLCCVFNLYWYLCANNEAWCCMPNIFTLSLITVFTIITVHFLISIELMCLDKSSAKSTIQNQLGILKVSKASSCSTGWQQTLKVKQWKQK